MVVRPKWSFGQNGRFVKSAFVKRVLVELTTGCAQSWESPHLTAKPAKMVVRPFWSFCLSATWGLLGPPPRRPFVVSWASIAPAPLAIVPTAFRLVTARSGNCRTLDQGCGRKSWSRLPRASPLFWGLRFESPSPSPTARRLTAGRRRQGVPTETSWLGFCSGFRYTRACA